MSRCFPFPPPGYSAKISINETLIESIKLKRETEKAKAERKKERRREKKEKRREKKEKNKSSNALVSGLDEKRREDDTKTKKRKRDEEKDRKSGEKRKRHEDKTSKPHSEKKIHVQEKSNLDDKKAEIDRVNTNEVLERSDLTQEHEQPFCSQNTYCLSDSSENSNQRRQQAASLHESTVNSQGKQLIRLRLPSLKNIQHSAVALSTSKDEQPCSSSGRAEDPQHVVLTKNEDKTSFVTALAAKSIISDQNLNMKQTTSVIASSSSSSSFDKKMKKVELVYKSLVENWVPPPPAVKMSDDPKDLDWLMTSRERGNSRPAAATAAKNGVGEERCSTMWPRAHYLTEADIYLMPYTIPF